MNYPAERLKKLLQEILRRSGSEADEAALVAEHLIQANLRGHDSHGAYIIGYYMDCLKKGALKSNMPARLVRDDGTMMIFDGGCGYGQRVAHEAVAVAIDRCRESGFVIMALRNSSHVGRIGTYGEQAAAAGYVSLHFVNTIEFPVIVVPLGGRQPRFKTNPICLTLPGTPHNPAIVLDFATSSIAFGKAYVAMKKGTAVPENTIVDHAGRATRDPAVLFDNPRGAMLPFGGHKGYGLLVFCELLAGILSGGGTVQAFDTRMEGTRNNMLSIIMDPARFAEPEWMHKAVDDFVDYVRSCPPVDPDQPVLMPGDMELAVMAVRRKEGIPLDKSSWEDILTAAEAVGLARQDAESMVAKP